MRRRGRSQRHKPDAKLTEANKKIFNKGKKIKRTKAEAQSTRRPCRAAPTSSSGATEGYSKERESPPRVAVAGVHMTVVSHVPGNYSKGMRDILPYGG
jgi:hypothetical protein